MSVLLVPPKWTPKNKAIPLKEEFIKFHQEVTCYHDCIEGMLIDGHNGFSDRLPEIPPPLDNYTKRSTIIIATADLMAILVDIVRLYKEAQRLCVECTPLIPSTALGLAAVDHSQSIKVALPNQFDRTTSKVLTFLMECNTYFALSPHQFHDHQVRI
jgi:hypothetical protein